MKVCSRVWNLRAGLVAACGIVGSCLPEDPLSIGAEAPALERAFREVPASAPAVPEAVIAMPTGHVVIGPERTVPVSIENTKLARLRVAALDAADLARVTAMVGVHPSGEDPLRALPRALRARLKTRALDPGVREVDVFRLAGSELVLGALEAPGAAPRVAIFQRGELGVLLKTGGDRGMVWVTSTRTGEPVQGADVTIQQGHGVRQRARTNHDGIAWLAPEKFLRVQYAAGIHQEDLQEPLVAVVRAGKHVAVASERWQTGIEPWQFQLPEIYYTGQDALRGSVYSERGLYRPGDRVHLLGVLRARRSDGSLAPPAGKLKVRVLDPDHTETWSDDIELTQFGTFRSELEIPRTARLGRYSIVLTKGAAELRNRFEVGEYRPLRFEVSLPATGSLAATASEWELPIRARYLYGAAVPSAAVSYTISARGQRQFGAWSEGYRYSAAEQDSELVPVSEGETALDTAGQGTIVVPRASLPEDLLQRSQGLELFVEASVRDRAGDVVAGRSVQSLLGAPALIGLRSDAWVVSPARGWTLKVLVSRADGTPAAGKEIVLRLLRKKWVGAAEEGAGEPRYEGEWQDEIVTTRKWTSGAQPGDVHFELPKGGEYRVEASFDGGTALSSERVWAYGGDAYGAWDNNARMGLHSDKPSYLPGERAKLYAEVPFTKSSALVTLEREGVLQAKVMKLEGSGTPIEVAISDRQAPNVFASIAVVPRELGTEIPAAGPPLRVGYQELAVSAEKRRLKVELRPASTRAKPGETVDVEVRVSDGSGRPARAEVTVWAADEGVLQLTGYAAPDPFLPAYERHAHQVRSSANLLRLTRDLTASWEEYGGDSAPGDDAGAAFRSRFLGTAFFSKGVVTDAAGHAVLAIALPDNLTRWRVMAAVADGGARFGSAQASIEASKPLSIEPALPRFLTRGDELDATMMVHNATARSGKAQVQLSVLGAELRGPDVQTIELRAGAQVPVHFALSAGRVGRVRLRGSVALGRERDGFQVDLPVNTPTLWQTELIGDGRLDEPRKIDVKLPSNAEPGLAELLVSVAPGVLASISGSVDALMEYPHGCVEQTTSRLIPMVLLEELMRSSGDKRLSGPEHRRRMLEAIAHVLEHQNGDGGFGLWPGSPSEGFLTAYALWGLLTASDHAYDVPAGSLRRGLVYLQSHASSGDDIHGQFSASETEPFAAFVLASAAQDDSGLGKKLASETKSLSRFGLGLLGAAFAERDRAASEPLLSELSGARHRAKMGSLVADGDGVNTEFLGYGRDLRATAALVRALVLAGKGQDAEDLIAGILAERRSDGSWGTTYNNLWALHALVDYAMSVNPGALDGHVTLSVARRPLARLDVSPKARFQTWVLAAHELPAPGKSETVDVSAPRGSGLRYTARLRWTDSVASASAIDHGFSVTRELLDAKTGAVVKTPSLGQLLRVRLIVVTPEAREQVALVDRLPAGFEAVDTALASSAADPSGAATEHSSAWTWRELHDERVSFFANQLAQGTHTAEYLARATRAGTFLRPAASVEGMYAPDLYGHGVIETVRVTP